MNNPIRVSHDIFMQMDLIVSKTMNKWSHPIRSSLQFHPSGHNYLRSLSDRAPFSRNLHANFFQVVLSVRKTSKIEILSFKTLTGAF